MAEQVMDTKKANIKWNNSLVGFKTKSGKGIVICGKDANGNLVNKAYLHERTSKAGKTYFSYAEISA